MKLLVTLDTDETGVIVAECPAIPGCVSEGRTEAEALENIREAISGCLAARLANGMPLTIAVHEVEVPPDACLALHIGRAGSPDFSEGRVRRDRQHGSHVILIKAGNLASLSVPLHRELAPGTLRALIRPPG